MNPLFIATVPEADVARTLRLWPELAGRRIRPLLVSALGDIFVETDAGEVLVVDPWNLIVLTQQIQWLIGNSYSLTRRGHESDCSRNYCSSPKNAESEEVNNKSSHSLSSQL